MGEEAWRVRAYASAQMCDARRGPLVVVESHYSGTNPQAPEENTLPLPTPLPPPPGLN